MTKRNWTVIVTGWAPFQMVSLEDGPLNQEQARRAARVIWPTAEVS
jgi:hypothetical protein